MFSNIAVVESGPSVCHPLRSDRCMLLRPAPFELSLGPPSTKTSAAHGTVHKHLSFQKWINKWNKWKCKSIRGAFKHGGFGFGKWLALIFCHKRYPVSALRCVDITFWSLLSNGLFHVFALGFKCFKTAPLYHTNDILDASTPFSPSAFSLSLKTAASILCLTFSPPVPLKINEWDFYNRWIITQSSVWLAPCVFEPCLC